MRGVEPLNAFGLAFDKPSPSALASEGRVTRRSQIHLKRMSTYD